jgi:hypothetical protein
VPVEVEAADPPTEAEVRLELMPVAVAVAEAEADVAGAEEDAAGGVDLAVDAVAVAVDAGVVGVPDRETLQPGLHQNVIHNFLLMKYGSDDGPEMTPVPLFPLIEYIINDGIDCLIRILYTVQSS